MSFWSGLAAVFASAPKPDVEVQRALLRVAELVDPFLANTRAYERRMMAPVQHALAYCNRMVDALPGPLEIERHAFAVNPLVHALFATSHDIDEMLGKSQAVRDYLDAVESHTSESIFALFAARRMEKRQLGVEVHGETVQSDVSQTVLYFADHTLTEPAGSLDIARQRLRSATFDSLLKTFRTHLDELRNEREGLRSHISAERGHLVQLRGKGEREEIFQQTRRVETLDARLRELAVTLLPDAVAEALAEFLKTPETSIRLEPCSVKVDRMGVLARNDVDAQDADTLEFPELISRDRRRYLVTLVRIDCEEARRAVREGIDRQRRYIVI